MMPKPGTTTAVVARPYVRQPTAVQRRFRSGVWAKIRREKWMYAFVLPGFLFFVVFRYLPLLGNIVAFENYSPYLGFFESPWVGLDNFAALVNDPAVGSALANTLIINGLQILFYFPATIGLALLLNSLISQGMKRVIQSIVYLPYFIGWVVLVSVWQSVLGGDGLLNQTLSNHGLATVNLMRSPAAFNRVLTKVFRWKVVRK